MAKFTDTKAAGIDSPVAAHTCNNRWTTVGIADLGTWGCISRLREKAEMHCTHQRLRTHDLASKNQGNAALLEQQAT